MSKELFLTLVLSLGVSTASGEAYELDLSNMPRSICGFPSLHTGGKFPEWNTRAAQRLLSFALSEDIPADGVFSDETTAQIEAFQQQAGLTVDGYLNINSWPTLLALATPLEPKATGSPVLALQDLLANTYGYGALASLSGVYDEATELAVADFQRRRKMDVDVAGAVDAETWHLLLTQCDNNPGNPNAGHYWFDAGWPQGNVSVATLECLQASGFEYAVFECWRNNNGGTFWAECVENVENAWKAGYDAVDVYMFPDRYYAADVQVRQLVANLTAADVKYGAIMIDIEGDYWFDFTQEENCLFMDALKSELLAQGRRYFVYAGSQWPVYFGDNYSAYADVPLIYAHYDNIPSFYDSDYAPYGGWARASGKQFFDGLAPEVLCDLPLDWDVSPEPFWRDFIQ